MNESPTPKVPSTCVLRVGVDLACAKVSPSLHTGVAAIQSHALRCESAGEFAYDHIPVHLIRCLAYRRRDSFAYILRMLRSTSLAVRISIDEVRVVVVDGEVLSPRQVIAGPIHVEPIVKIQRKPCCFGVNSSNCINGSIICPSGWVGDSSMKST